MPSAPGDIASFVDPASGWFKELVINANVRSAETLIRMEEELRRHQLILRELDASSPHRMRNLGPAIARSLKRDYSHRNGEDDEWVRRFDDFLRFLLLLSALERFKLLKTEALMYMYWYWFCMVLGRPIAKEYVRKNFPTLYSYMRSNRHRRQVSGASCGG